MSNAKEFAVAENGEGVLSMGVILVSSIMLLLDAIAVSCFVKGHVHPI